MENDTTYLNLLGELQSHYSQNKFEVYIPSKNKTVEFTPISVKQHKDILKTFDNVLLTTFQFNININDMILANIVNCNDLLISDKASVVLSIKANQTSGDNIKIQIDNESHEVDINKQVETFKHVNTPKRLVSKTVSLNNLKVKCKIPSLQYDNAINKEIISKLKSKKTDMLTDSMGEIFVYEILKFIDSIDTGSTPITFNELSFDQKVQVCEMIPLELSNKIIEYINKVKLFEQKYTQCKSTTGADIELPLSVTLFASD
jgi:hypothetical protein